MARLKGNTKEIILERSLELFAIHGFAAVSIRAIADSVGIGNSALYKHYESKQAIFDSLVQHMKTRYLEQSSPVNAEIRGLEDMEQNCLRMFEYQTQDPGIVAFRQMLLIEKFRNPQMAELYKEFFVDIPLMKLSEIFSELQQRGLMVRGDPQVFAMELYSPFYLFHFVEYDRDLLMEQYRKHIHYYFETYFIAERR